MSAKVFQKFLYSIQRVERRGEFFLCNLPKPKDVRPWGLYQPFATQEEIFVKRRGEIIKFLHWQLWDPSRKQQKLKNAFLNDVSVTFK